MIYYWVLKYILYNTYTKRSLSTAYFEGGAMGLLVLFLVAPFLIFTGNFSKGTILFIGFLSFVFDSYMIRDNDHVDNKYKYIDLNRAALKPVFKRVYWFIVLDILFFIITLIIIILRQKE
jgi:hypothetical protein